MSRPGGTQPGCEKVVKSAAQGVYSHIVSALLCWFANSARDLPWRRTRDPYAIWVSEIMLQQTQVKTVIPFWQRWMKRLPTIRSLARARSQTIHKLWEGLGYYLRVRNMQRAARTILRDHDGRFPKDFDRVLALPGIGRYTAGAICSIAFNQPKPILDGNVTRVLARIFALRGDPRDKDTNAKLWRIAEALVETAGTNENKPKKNGSGNCSTLNQALMELGALVCTPKLPRCASCPVRSFCVAAKNGWASELPEPGARPVIIRRHFAAFVVAKGDKLLVRQRPGGVVNAHLWEFPNFEIESGADDSHRRAVALLGVQPGSVRPLCQIKHSITRYRMQLDAYRGTAAFSARSRAQGSWLKMPELQRLPFTGAHKKILERLQAGAGAVALASVFLLSCALLFPGCAPRSSDRLTVGMELNYPPFEMIDQQGHPAGVSVELARELAKSLHRELRLENIPFDGLIPALKTGKIDLILSSMTETPERAQSIDFSDPYLRTGLCLLINKAAPLDSIADVDKPNVTVAVKQGTTGQLYAAGHLKNARILVLDKEDACVLEVIQNKAQAFIYDQMSVLKHWQQHQDSTRALLKPFQEEQWAIGIRKGQEPLKTKVNLFLREFKASGGFETLGTKYLAGQKEALRKLNIPFYF